MSSGTSPDPEPRPLGGGCRPRSTREPGPPSDPLPPERRTGARTDKQMPNPRRGLRILVSSPTGVSTGARTSENLVTNANPDGTTERERVQPEVVDPVAASADTAPSPDAAEQVTRPTKLIRIASMVRTMLEEVRLAPLDDSGPRRLREIHERSLAELEEVLSP